MSSLFRRSWKLQVGTIMIDGTNPFNATLDISFLVEKTDKREPNTASISVYNLSSNHRRSIEDASVTSVILHAGYKEDMQVIFSGDIHRAKNRRKSGSKKGGILSRVEETGWVTEIDASDAGNSFRDTRVSRTYHPGSSVYSVVRDIVNDMALGEGNLRMFTSYFVIPGVGTEFADGTVVSGLAHREMDRIVRSCGMTWSIQDGNVQITRNGQPAPETAVLLSSSSGLVGSPQKEQDGTYQLQTLLIPSIYPGRKLVVEASECNAQLVATKVSYSGDTTGNDWYCDIEAKVY